jgi:molybdate transport system substrate-binding protein
MKRRFFALFALGWGLSAGASGLAAEVKVLTAGAFKSMLVAGEGDSAPAPDVRTVDAFKHALLAAKSVAYIDPATGGSSGICLANLFERLGIADEIKARAKLKRGGYVADLIVSGEAELGIHQISEILPVGGVTLVGPLPAEIQNYTVYAGGLSARAAQPEAAGALVKWLAGPQLAPVLRSKDMEPPGN